MQVFYVKIHALSLLQNTSVISVDKISLLSACQVDIIYTIRKRRSFSIGCYQPIPKIIIGIGWLKTADTNKCHAWPISKVLLVSTSLIQSTSLSHVQIKNII
jgi:hypothetical protein